MSDILEEFDGKKTLAAEKLGVSRRTLSGLEDDSEVPRWIAAAFRDYVFRARGTVPAKWMPK